MACDLFNGSHECQSKIVFLRPKNVEINLLLKNYDENMVNNWVYNQDIMSV